ncbi:DUF4389 domain-containing protein [Saccharopolyspora griseoalba]|uniref:DUF4389 domain-containing protein n=1 Tax=Saccharopolyspora griseoalba TaxID=1431848 RepID=A0ABW2LSM4_9PSEU
MTDQVEPGRFLPEMMIAVPERQRRWTVLLRALLLIPHFVVVWALGIAANVVVFIGWWAALFLGRLPEWISGFLALYVDYSTRVSASSMLLIDTYPTFVISGPDEALRTEFHPGRLNRLAVLFRFVLLIPAAIVSGLVMAGWSVLAFFIWLIVLVAGRTPRPIFDASAAALRYNFRTNAYVLLLTGSYPKKLFGDEAAEPKPPRVSYGTRPLTMSSGGRALLIAFLVLGVLGIAGSAASSAAQQPPCDPYGHGYATGCAYAE